MPIFVGEKGREVKGYRQNQARWLCQRRLKQGYLQGSERGLRGKLRLGYQESGGCHRSEQAADC